MNAIILVFLAAGFSALSNLFFRKNSTSNSGPNGYLLLYYFSALIFSFLIDPSIWKIGFNPTMFAMGGCVGLLSASLMLLMSRALKVGPAGMTFAFQNASAVFPGISLFLLFGREYGYSFSYLQLGGILLVLVGLFVGAKKQNKKDAKASLNWLKYALACFLIQILALTLIQGRCIVLNSTYFQCNLTDDVWFMPGQFGIACCFQLIVFLREKRFLQGKESFYGLFGGSTNFVSTSLQLLATKIALPFEQAILFPCFAVGTIILCNLWANRLYKEDFNLTTNAICSVGIFMGMLS